MSNLSTELVGHCEAKTCPAIKFIIQGKSVDLGGLQVKRVLPSDLCKMVGPFIFFDEMGPTQFAAGTGVDIRPHPHIGLATITYLFQGEIDHRDSLGSFQKILPGELNVMVAGEGIVHSERTGTETRETEHVLHGLQIWIALPDEQAQTSPSFNHVKREELPTVAIDQTKLTVVLGDAFGKRSPVEMYSKTLYLDIQAPQSSDFTLPADIQEKAIYVIEGKLQIGNTTLEQHSLCILDDSNNVCVTAQENSRYVLIGGDNIGDKHIWWNFVSSDPDIIAAARERWINHEFDDVPGDDEFIPLD